MPSLTQVDLRRMMKLERMKKQSMKLEEERSEADTPHSKNSKPSQPIRGILKKPNITEKGKDKEEASSSLNDLMEGYMNSDSDESDYESSASSKLNNDINTCTTNKQIEVNGSNLLKKTKIRFSDDTKDIVSVSKLKKVRKIEQAPPNTSQSIKNNAPLSTTSLSFEIDGVENDSHGNNSSPPTESTPDIEKEFEDFLESVDDDTQRDDDVTREIPDKSQQSNETKPIVSSDNLAQKIPKVKKKKRKSSIMESNIDNDVMNEVEQVSYEARLAKLMLLRSRNKSDKKGNSEKGDQSTNTSDNDSAGSIPSIDFNIFKLPPAIERKVGSQSVTCIKLMKLNYFNRYYLHNR